VHFIGFVRERSFQPGELSAVIQFVASPHLFKDAGAVKAAIDTWPLQPAQLLNGVDRPRSDRTPGNIEPDALWPGMWRVTLPTGDYSNKVNLTRAKDAARTLVLALRNRNKQNAA
jgi:hypothetical protein